jgi:hypothetical protein
LTDQLRTTVERSCLLLIVMSPRYLASAWCKDELAWFEGQFVERRKGLGRVFIVRAVSTDESKWPRCLKDERGHADLGFRFHPVTDKAGVPPHGWLRPKPGDCCVFCSYGSVPCLPIQAKRLEQGTPG